ncbi:serine/threonine-protein kinase TAO1-B isoform X3 [Patella vulgata]|uniref:serine/threonine-protein kinase TAO1-B isoform X3 n=1 Tax=Patella vulgata TaxID=6465 RepID=UPI002180599D|nr:serine/threonine-protein kinase TAO1-B isoform X3 [Patella vulgata]
MPHLPKPGNLKDPDVVGLFCNDDPDKIFSELREIGHGSFGAVYFAKNVITKEVVAIKKMSFSGKGATDKWQDIVKEVKFLRQLSHRNTIDYKGCYIKDNTAWLVMEYCLGSASDIIEVHKKPLREIEIAAICQHALRGLSYLHSLNRIHRDVKAGNILLTENGTVKLADFGSASLVSPANSFVGTPYWMAPEVILAMDEGQYDGKSDIWSLGITCIELAERKPPLFNMNAMSALYHIAQNDSPSLSGGDWSDNFRNFVDVCLAKNPADRPSADELLHDPFITSTHLGDVINELIYRTKNAVRKLDNLQYRRLQKLIINGEHEGNINEEKDSNDTDDVETSSQDDDPDGSKSGSLTSHNSNCASSQSSITSYPGATTDITSFTQVDGSPPHTVHVQLHQIQQPSASSSSLDVGTSNFATIRTTSIVHKQIKEHEHSNELREQFTGYKRLRKQHQKELQTMENKFAIEMEEHKTKLDKEYEKLRNKFATELERLRLNHISELDKKQKAYVAQEKKVVKDTLSQQETDRRSFSENFKRSYRSDKEQLKKDHDSKSTPRKEKEDAVKTYKEATLRKMKNEEYKLQKQHQDHMDFKLRIFNRQKKIQFHRLEQSLLREELSQKKAQLEYEHRMSIRHHESTQDLEFKHLAALQKLRDEQLRKQHEMERENQKEYNARVESDLKKKHAMEVKQQPRSLRQKEIQIRKQFNEAVKTQQKQYKALKEHILHTTPKNEQKAVGKKLKEEQMRKLALLGEQYEQSIAEMLQQQNVRLDEAQLAEANELKQRLQQELELLIAYQSKLKMQAESQHQKERKQLEERVSLRRALLEQKMDDERMIFEKEEKERLRHQLQKQERELHDFDVETAAKGLNALEVADASLREFDNDTNSVRGSMLSLSGSSSTSSFSSQTPL